MILHRNVNVSVLTLFLTLQVAKSAIFEETNSTSEDYEAGLRVLSRRKRFLHFPEGSSLQLVFCLQTAALIPIGDIFLYGNTVALAWTLPTDPDLYHLYKDKALRRGDTKEVIYVDDKGKLLAEVPFRRAPIVNPVFARRSVDDNIPFKERLKMKLHERQLSKEYLNTKHMNKKSIEFHRSSRIGLYDKIEKLFSALGRNGRQCVLYKLCEVARAKGIPSQGTFLQELLTVVFSLPKGKELDNLFHKEYDIAHMGADDCMAKYPGCHSFLEEDDDFNEE